MRKLLSRFSLLTMLFIGVGLFMVPFAADAQAAAQGSEGFSFFNLLTGGVDVFYGLLGKIFWWVAIPLAGLLFQLLGLIIDSAIVVSLESTIYNSEAIGLAWSIIRDICNMVFIFVLIYEGIRTILSLGNPGSVKRTIVSVVIAAILLNFSLFFTKVVIDASNIAVSWFIQGIQNVGGADGVSDSIRAVLQMEKLASTNRSLTDLSTYTLESFTVGFLLFALTCVAIYVFFNIVFLVVGRIVAFIFLLIMSPIGFVGSIIEMKQLKEYGEGWKNELLSQAMMLPLFFLMVYITLFIVDRVQEIILKTTEGGGTSEFAPVNYVMFIIVIMMLLRALKTAQKMSEGVGKIASGIIRSATGFVGGAALMGTVGRAASAIKQSESLKNAASTSAAARGVLRSVDLASTASFGTKSNYNSLVDKAPLAKSAFKGADKGYEGKKKAEIEVTKKTMDMIGKGPGGAQRKLNYSENLKNKPSLIGFTLDKMGAPKASQYWRNTNPDVQLGNDTLKKDKDIAKHLKEQNEQKLKKISDEANKAKESLLNLEAELDEINKNGSLGGIAIDKLAQDREKLSREIGIRVLKGKLTELEVEKKRVEKDIKSNSDVVKEAENDEQLSKLAKQLKDKESPEQKPKEDDKKQS